MHTGATSSLGSPQGPEEPNRGNYGRTVVELQDERAVAAMPLATVLSTGQHGSPCVCACCFHN